MGPDWYGQNGWHHVGMGYSLELLAGYGALLLIAALVAGALWWTHRRHARADHWSRRAEQLHRWPTASLASPAPQWGKPHWQADEGRLRASHADRERAVTLLREATAEGYLTLDEFEERLGSVYEARYLRDLDPLVDDIPGHPRPAALEPAPSAWRPLPARSQPVVGVATIFFALAILAIATHAWFLPAWPLLLLVFLALRVGRHRRHFDGHWGPRS